MSKGRQPKWRILAVYCVHNLHALPLQYLHHRLSICTVCEGLYTPEGWRTRDLNAVLHVFSHDYLFERFEAGLVYNEPEL
ncbi:hypothetical protein TWF751_007670 [Orbilia oligospora]|nr:hypothetical protein TWF751_007670 [Orbilia oligospora]